MTSPAYDEMDPLTESLKSEGNFLLRQGDARRAADKYTEALVRAPRNPVLLSNRASAYSHLNPPNWTAAYAGAQKRRSTIPRFGKDGHDWDWQV
jgi:hypothetical protein